MILRHSPNRRLKGIFTLVQHMAKFYNSAAEADRELLKLSIRGTGQIREQPGLS